jgi:transposase
MSKAIMPNGRVHMKKTRWSYDRDFKISVVAELECGKPPARISREYGIHPGLPFRLRDELAKKSRNSV